MKNNIELELRAEVSISQFKLLLSKLNKNYKQILHNKRLSAMFLGKINRSHFDIRVRINSDKKTELVVKKGKFHKHDRIESSQEITKDQFIGIVEILSLLDFNSKITERDNFAFDLGNNIILSLVKANSIAYVEVEKMSNANNLEKNKLELLKIIKQFDLRLIKNDKEFNNLCERLTKYSDWTFDGSKKHIIRLKKILRSY